MHHGGPPLPPPQGQRMNMMPPGMMPGGGMQNSHGGMMSPHQMMINHQQGPPPHGGMMMMAPPMQPGMNHKGYPNQNMIYNQQNPNTPPIYLCGACNREVQVDTDEAIGCESGCNFWFHRACINMTHEALVFLKKEMYAEWVCDNCLHNKPISLIKFKS
jgi:hypothetical protein